MNIRLSLWIPIGLSLAGCGHRASVGTTPPHQDAAPSISAEKSSSPPSSTGESTAPDRQARAKAASRMLFQRLSARLTEAMTAKGPAGAIDVCAKEARPIAQEVGALQGVSIGRTARRLRNPDNQPPEWARALIEDNPRTPRFIELGDQRTGALIPIFLKEKCLTCHGDPQTIPTDVKEKLAALYPEDQATGFAPGDLRGWFWVEVPSADTP